jgi:elongation factor P
MAQISGNELKRKQNILIDDKPHVILEVQYASPSARGASTMAKVRVRNLLTGNVQDKTFRTNEVFNEPDIEKVTVVYQYADADVLYFMDGVSYEQFFISKENAGDQIYYLKEDMEVQAIKFNGKVISLELPVVVELAVTETTPPIKGGSAAGKSSKKATLETGLETHVPLYIEVGTIVRVNTETGECSGKAN